MNPKAASEQFETQQRIAAVTAVAMANVWRRVGDDFDAGWANVRPQAIATMQLGRAATIHRASPYIADVLRETGQAAAPVGVLNPGRFLEYAPNGMPVSVTLDAAPLKAKHAIAAGMSVMEARALVGRWLTGTTLTMLADTRRDVYQADIIQRPTVTGYVRMVHAGACNRCIILAGKWFRWNKGFARHPNCYCTHIPAAEKSSGDLTTDPYEHFNSMDEKSQNRTFGKNQAQAVRDGADIYRVVNSKTAGMTTVGGSTARGVPNRRTLADIYAHDKNRQHVISNLEYHGWITGPQKAGGNIVGNLPTDARILAAGPGRGTYTLAGQTAETNRAKVYDAVKSGARDPLERATMTAAERRLFDAHYRAEWARAGYKPNTIGANYADRGLGLKPISSAEAARIEQSFQTELARAIADTKSPDVRRLAGLLG